MKTIAVMIVFTVSLIEFTLKSPTSLKNKIDAQKKKRKNSDAQDCDEESDKAGIILTVLGADQGVLLTGVHSQM